MPLLKNSKHEQFAQLVATGVDATEAYQRAGYSGGGARASASRLLTNATVSARISEIRREVAAEGLRVAIQERNARLKLLQDTVDRIGRLIEERGAEPDMQAVPGGSTGLLCRDYKGKDANKAVYRFDAELMRVRHEALERAAIEVGEWKQKVEHGGALTLQLLDDLLDEPADMQQPVQRRV